jgi:hypothetical protein
MEWPLAVGVNLLPAVETFSEPALGDPFQCRVDGTQSSPTAAFSGVTVFHARPGLCLRILPLTQFLGRMENYWAEVDSTTTAIVGPERHPISLFFRR